MLTPDMTTEVFFGPELSFMAWRSENPELFVLIVVLSLLLVAALCLFWWLGYRERNITAMRIERERARKNRAARMNGGM